MFRRIWNFIVFFLDFELLKSGIIFGEDRLLFCGW